MRTGTFFSNKSVPERSARKQGLPKSPILSPKPQGRMCRRFLWSPTGDWLRRTASRPDSRLSAQSNRQVEPLATVQPPGGAGFRRGCTLGNLVVLEAEILLDRPIDRDVFFLIAIDEIEMRALDLPHAWQSPASPQLSMPVSSGSSRCIAIFKMTAIG